MKFLRMLLFVLLLPCLVQAAPAGRTVQSGVLDLKGMKLDTPMEARGDWEFYWEEYVTPATLEAAAPRKSLMHVPGLWTQSKAKHPVHGYATYRLKVLLDRPERITLHFPAGFWSASRVFVEDEMLTEFGTLGSSAETSVGGIGTKTHEFIPKSAEFDIIVQIANYEIFLGGMVSPIQLGSQAALASQRERTVAVDLFIIGALFIMGMYHLCLYLLRREDRSTMWFGMMCLGVGLHIASTRSGALTVFMPNLGFDARLRFYNVSWMAGVVSFAWFAFYIFRGLYSRWVCWAMTAVTLGFYALILSTSARIFVGPTLGYQLATMGIVIYSMYAIIRACVRRVEGARIFLGGVLLLLFTTINDLLGVRQLIQSPQLAGFGLFGFIFFQSYMIAMRFSAAFTRVKLSEKEIRGLSDDLKHEHDKVIELNTNLEKLVDEKTRDIRSIMEHIPLGVFMIQSDHKIHKDHSRNLTEILQVKDLESGDATQLLFDNTTLSSDEKSQANSCIEASLGEDVLNFETNIHILPLEMRRKMADDKPQIFDITWNTIEDAKGCVDKILVTVRDVTEIRILQERNKDQQEELEFIGEILSVPTPRFVRFIQSCRQLIQENYKLLRSQGFERRNLEVLKLLFINMHTVKGSARSLYLKKMTRIFHEIEQYYAHLQKNPTAIWEVNKMEADLQEAQKMVAIYEKIAREKLGRSPDQTHLVDYHIEQIEEVYRHLSQVVAGKSLPADVLASIAEVKELFFTKIFKDAREVFSDLFGCLPVLAKDLQKELPDVQLETHGILLGERAEELFRNIFVHILRNSMDHGLENATERQSRNKTPNGLIQIVMERHEQTLRLTFRDDGRGLAIGRIREIGLVRGLIEPDKAQDPYAVGELIFDSGLSTANQLTDISGRGVGMDAVRSFIQKAGGEIHIRFEAGSTPVNEHYPFHFVVELPFELFEESIDKTRIVAA